MNVYEFISIVLLPYTLVTFIINYLSDIEIIDKELLIGVLQFVHHLLLSLLSVGPFSGILFGVKNIFFILLITLIFLGAQIGYIINNEYCFYTIFVNKLINLENPKRKFIGDLPFLIKKYIRGDEWAYSPINKINNDQTIIGINYLIILNVIRIIINK